jgi:hypothetical protein
VYKFNFLKLTSGVRIRIRNAKADPVIRIANADPDPGEQNQCEFKRIRNTGFQGNKIFICDFEFQNTRGPVSLHRYIICNKGSGGGGGNDKNVF